MPLKKATIVILNYSKAEQVLVNVRTLLKQRVDFAYKVIVIDNSADRESASIILGLSNLPGIEIVVNDKNYGYPKAHNLAKSRFVGDYLVIVNPDIEWTDRSALARMIEYMDAHPSIGILGPKHVLGDGSIEITARSFPRLYLQLARRSNLKNLGYFASKIKQDEMADMDKDEINEVDWLHSSCIVVRKELWDKIGGFNDSYFLFMSDTELCLKAWHNGYKVLYFPCATVRSDGIRVSAGTWLDFFRSWTVRAHFKDSLKFRLNNLGKLKRNKK